MNGLRSKRGFQVLRSHSSPNTCLDVKLSLHRRRNNEAVTFTSLPAITPSLIIFQDHSFRQSLSPIGREACEIVSRIRAEEQASIWNSDLEGILAQKAGGNVYPGMMFSLAKDRMEKTKLWQIVRKMPKGALLHAHMDAMVDFDYLFNVLLETKGMHIYSAQHLGTEEARGGASFKFRFQKTDRGMSSQ